MKHASRWGGRPKRKSVRKARRRIRNRQSIMYGSGMSYYSAPLMHGYGMQGYGMHGYGLGNVLARLARGIIPLFRKPAVQAGLKRLGKSAAMAGIDAAQRSLSTPNLSFGQALQQSGAKQVRQLKREFLGPAPKRRKTLKGLPISKSTSVAFNPSLA